MICTSRIANARTNIESVLQVSVSPKEARNFIPGTICPITSKALLSEKVELTISRTA